MLKFIDEGVESESQQFKYPALSAAGTPHPLAGLPKMQFNIKVELMNGEQKLLSLNGTSFRQLSEKWGEDTNNWIGKLALVTLVPLPTGKKMISLTPED